MPRSDLLTGGLTAALTVVIGLVLDRSLPFDFAAVEAAFATLITFGVGWWVSKYKPLAVAITAPVASLLTVAVGYFLFAVPVDEGLLSTLVATIAGAILTAGKPPFDASPLDIDAPAAISTQRKTTYPRG